MQNKEYLNKLITEAENELAEIEEICKGCRYENAPLCMCDGCSVRTDKNELEQRIISLKED